MGKKIQDPILKVTKAKKSWGQGHGSSARMLAQQE
jgi:hypothetical protein